MKLEETYLRNLLNLITKGALNEENIENELEFFISYFQALGYNEVSYYLSYLKRFNHKIKDTLFPQEYLDVDIVISNLKKHNKL